MTRSETLLNGHSFKTAALALVLGLGASLGATTVASADQLARSAGVEPGVYPKAVLMQIVQAKADNNTAQLRHILREANAKKADPAQAFVLTVSAREAKVGEHLFDQRRF